MHRAVIILFLLALLAPTAQARWAPIDHFDDGARARIWPLAAYDDTGRGHLVWASITTDLAPFWPEATVHDGTGWSTPTRIGDGASQLQPIGLSAGGNGYAVLTMAEAAGGGSVLLASRYADGRWVDPVRLSDVGRVASTASQAVTATGEVLVVWFEDATRLRAARFADGFWSVVDIATVVAPGDFTHVVVDGDGVPTVAWSDVHGSATGWFAARRVAGAWSSAVLVAAPGPDAVGSALALVDGRPLLVWGRVLAPGPNWRTVVEASRFDGAQWSSTETVAEGARLGEIDAASLHDGSAMAVWQDGPGGLGLYVRVTRRTAAGWSSPVQVNGSAGGYEPEIAPVGIDGALVGWRWANTPYAAVLAGGTWSTTQLGEDQSSGNEPTVAGSRDGAALLAWEDDVTAPFATDVRRLVDVPGPPLLAAATAGDGDAVVGWSPPLLVNGSRITSYAVTSVPDGRTCTAIEPARTCTVTGLRNGRTYRFQVSAANAEGSGSAATSAAVRPRARPTVKVLSTSAAGGSLRTWIQVSGPGTVTQVGRSAAVEPRVCRVALTVRKAGRVLVVCTPGRRVRTQLPCRPVRVRLSTVFRSPDRVRRVTVREVRLDACLRVAAVTG